MPAHQFDPWLGMIPHTLKQLSQHLNYWSRKFTASQLQLRKPLYARAGARNKRSPQKEKPALHN